VAEHITEEDQIEALKQWWEQYQYYILVPVIVCILGYGGWSFWQNQQQAKASEASARYEELLGALEVTPGEALSDTAESSVRAIAADVITDYEGSLYADNSALILARLDVEDNAYDSAAAHLQAVVDKGANKAVKALATARLARVKLAQGKLSDALNLVNANTGTAFKSVYAEIRADILVAQGDALAAEMFYQEAIDSLIPAQQARRSIITLKKDGAKVLAASQGDTAATVTDSAAVETADSTDVESTEVDGIEVDAVAVEDAN